MIPLTDLALFNAMTAIIGTNTGVWAAEDQAFRQAKAKYGKLELPIFSLWRPTIEKDDLRWNRPAANRGGANWRDTDIGEGHTLKLMAVNVPYEFHLWDTEELDLLDFLRDIYYFSVEGSKNGVYLNYPDLHIVNMGVPLTMDLSTSIDKSTETEQGKWYHATMSMMAHTWWAKGLDNTIVKKIVASLYDYTASYPEVNEKHDETVGYGDGSTAVYVKTLSYEVVPGTLRIFVVATDSSVTEVAEDDKEGNVTGTGVTGTIGYESKALQLTFSTPPENGAEIYAEYMTGDALFLRKFETEGD